MQVSTDTPDEPILSVGGVSLSGRAAVAVTGTSAVWVDESAGNARAICSAKYVLGRPSWKSRNCVRSVTRPSFVGQAIEPPRRKTRPALTTDGSPPSALARLAFCWRHVAASRTGSSRRHSICARTCG